MPRPEIEEGISHLPEELLSNILIRLTWKLVVRCKLVCKQWASLISDPFFVHSYRSRLPPSSSSWTVVGERIKDRCIEYDQPRHMRSRQDFNTLLSLSIIGDREREAKVSGASDGMILFGLLVDCCSSGNSYNSSCSLYYICNPAVRKLIPLSPLPPESLAAKRLRGSGLVESFRVVLLMPAGQRLRFGVYASETQQWNEYSAPQPLPARIFNRRPAALNQKLH